MQTNSKTYTVQGSINKPIDLDFENHPSGGFELFITNPHPKLAIKKANTEGLGEDDAIGDPVLETYRFIAEEAGTYEVQIEEKRPFEPDKILNIYIVKLEIK